MTDLNWEDDDVFSDESGAFRGVGDDIAEKADQRCPDCGSPIDTSGRYPVCHACVAMDETDRASDQRKDDEGWDE